MTYVLYTFKRLKLWNSDVEMQHAWQAGSSTPHTVWLLEK